MGREEDHRRFEKTRRVDEERTRNVSEEADEGDRRKWEETRDLGQEASEAPEEQHERPPTEKQDQ